MVLTLLQLCMVVSGFGSDKHVRVGGLFTFRDSPDESSHIDDSFFNTDSLSMYNSVLNHVSTAFYHLKIGMTDKLFISGLDK